MQLPTAIREHIECYAQIIERYSKKLAALYRNCYPNTIETVLVPHDDGTCFVLTGDIPAMWLRDSTAQVSHYMPVAAEDAEVRALIRGVIARQFNMILIDPYANAFNEEANGHGHVTDRPLQDPHVWERKYEIDSLCYPLRLLDLYIRATNDTSLLDERFHRVAATVLGIFRTEQRHFEKSPYRFFRDNVCATDTLTPDGMGKPVGYTGMTWSGFRPSDDSCYYGYPIASNFFALKALAVIASYLPAGDPLIAEADSLAKEIKDGIYTFGVTEHPVYGKMFVCEADGLGKQVCLDDANVPSLLSLPYLGCLPVDDPIYQNTRRFILSPENPFYFEGKAARGIGSPHTPAHYVWHIALSMQGLTATDPDEVKSLLRMLETTDADTGFMHEGFDADDPTKFTRKWFAWSNSLFAEFVESAVDRGIIG